MPNIFGSTNRVGLFGTSTTCPRCGGRANIGSGRYRVNAGEVEIISGLPSTFELFEALREVVDRAKAKAKQGTAQAEEILAEVADVSPELANKLRAKHTFPVFVLILLLVWLIKSVELKIDIDLNHLIDQAYHVMQGDDPELHLDTPVPAAPNLLPPPSRPEPSQLPPTTLAGKPAIPPNRQARRKQKAQARRRPKGPSRL